MTENFISYQNVEISKSILLRYDPCQRIIKWDNANSDVRDLAYSKVQEIEEYVTKNIICGKKYKDDRQD